ncbi:MAG: hypothetical protein BVN28_04865 [Nitrospira sp. ST-bin4]|nr:MAG: hypothetical protein BVN28_04865 [Nitrospira sp. ST-bin4]
MNLLQTHRADTGVCLRPDGITMVRVMRAWRQPAKVRCIEERPIRSGLLRPSCTEVNVENVDELARDLAAAVGSARTRTVALSLPDGCVSMAILPFESLPVGERERETLVRWRFQHDRRCALTDEQIAYRIYPAPARTPHPAGSADGGTVTAYVMAIAVKPSILRQYHMVCEQAGLLPVSIGFSSLQAFDLCRMSVAPASEHFWALRMSDRLTFVACRGGVPVFLRGTRVKEHDDVRAELVSSLQCFDDDCPHSDGPSGTDPAILYVMREQVDEQKDQPEDRALWTPAGHPRWQVEVRNGWPEGRQLWPPDTTMSIGRWCALASTEVV